MTGPCQISTPRHLPVHRYVLSEYKPSVVYIPPGCAHGFMSLAAGSKLMSWDCWHVVER
jgi:dTDP-4-dehydrorhamnose 3,5-epimerase-like enzyme